MSTLDLALSIGVFGFSAIMFVLSMVSYVKTKISKLLPLSLAFLLILLKGLYLSAIVIGGDDLDEVTRVVLMMDFFVILLIYVAAAKR